MDSNSSSSSSSSSNSDNNSNNNSVDDLFPAFYAIYILGNTVYGHLTLHQMSSIHRTVVVVIP